MQPIGLAATDVQAEATHREAFTHAVPHMSHKAQRETDTTTILSDQACCSLTNDAGKPDDVLPVQAKKNMQVAGLYFLHCNTYHIAPKPTQLEIAEYPENALFRRLESMQPREKPLQLEPGQILLAVYGDNWWVQPLTLLPQ